MTNDQQEVIRLLTAAGVSGPEKFVFYPKARVWNAIYGMRLQQKGPGWLVAALRAGEEKWPVPVAPAYWSPFDLRPPQDIAREAYAREKAEKRWQREAEETAREIDLRRVGRPPTEEERRDLHTLMQQMMSGMTPEERATVQRLRDARRGRTEPEEASE